MAVERRPASAHLVAALLLALILGIAGAQPAAEPEDDTPTATTGPLSGFAPRVLGHRPTVAQMTDLGRGIFTDPGLSASGRLSCASCHSPQHAFGPPNGLAAQMGGMKMTSRARGRRRRYVIW